MKRILLRRRIFFIFLALLLSAQGAMCAQTTGWAYIYCFPELSSLDQLLSYFGNHSDWKVTVYNLNESTSLDNFLNITRMLSVLGIKIIPPDLCTLCMLKQFTWDEILTIYASPLVGFFRNERLTAISLGITDHEALDKALAANDKDVKVFTRYGVCSLSNVTDKLEQFFPIKRGESAEITISNIVLPLTLLALADSVNPCTFALFTALILITLHSFGEMKAATAGFSFILAVFIGYYALGLGVFRILVTIPYISKVLAALGLAAGIMNIFRGLRGFRSPVPRFFRNFMESKMRKSYASIIAPFVLGFAATFTLLPCSGGPYIVGLGLLSTLKDMNQVHILLALYNLIFVMPLIFIITAILAFTNITYKVKVLRSTKLGIMELTSGALLTIVCTYLVLAS